MSLRRFGIDIRLEHYNRRGLGLNEALQKVPRECGTSIAWAYINGRLVVGQWHIMRLLRSNPRLLKELIKRGLVYIWK
ncbi:MAG: hypothetical protein DRJ60_06690 [Thermoprotei archaeon]|nr:MAG: hypothetical protein DRJ60_06690 [Thermoprotei archaeon]